ncbi:MAG TPA: hypothetical protein VEF37_00605, partial [Thermodesulfovibrionales bacterium]|nr:hypothetical protein [Thermodesulfovibrionales bacterium]
RRTYEMNALKGIAGRTFTYSEDHLLSNSLFCKSIFIKLKQDIAETCYFGKCSSIADRFYLIYIYYG